MEIKMTTSTIDLVKILYVSEDQEIINQAALELAKRIYVPNDNNSFEEMLKNFGYKKEENIKQLKRK